jgi:hypothetical protein
MYRMIFFLAYAFCPNRKIAMEVDLLEGYFYVNEGFAGEQRKGKVI